MRYVTFLGLFLCCIYAYAQPRSRIVHPESYYNLDTSKYLSGAPFAKIKDSITQQHNAAEAAGNTELQLSLKLYIYLREYQEKQVSSDTTEYRLLQMISAAHEKNETRTEADVIQALGNVYSQNNQQCAAIEQYLSAYAIYRNIDILEYPAKQNYTYQLGLIFYKYEDYVNAIKYMGEAFQLMQVAGNSKYTYSPITNTVGLCYRNMNLYDSAITYFQLVRDTSLKHGDSIWNAIAQGNIGITYYYQKKYNEAIPLLKKDIDYGLANSNIRNAVNSMAVLAAVYCELSKYDEAEKLLLSALYYCHKKSFWGDYFLAERIYEQLYKVYGFRKNYRLSYIYADSALMAKDSTASRYNALSLSQSNEKQNYIKKKLEAENKQNNAKLDQVKKFDQQQLLYKFIIAFLIVVLTVAIIVNRYRGNLKNIATSTKDAPEIVVQKMSIVIISIATCAAALVWTGLYYYYYGFCVITLFPFMYFLIVGPALLVYFFTKKHELLVDVQLVCIFFLTLLIELNSGGFKGGVVIFWAFLAPVGALMYKSMRHAGIWMALFILSIICLAVFHDRLSASYHPIPETAQFMFDCMNILGPVIVIYFSMQFFVKSVIRDGKLLQENNLVLSSTLGELKTEKQKSDKLLLNILPGEVADELKAKGMTTAKHFDNVTVLFTDFVNFTEAGGRMSPQQLVDELHTCFKAFDEIADKYKIEKIKTVGDAYLAVAGLPTPDPKHAENIVQAAIEINAYMHNRQTINENTFKIRIGINSGSVVAGIVGVKKFAYDIWGDTVNTAARMEQNSEPGRINISQTTYDLVKNKFNCEFRGEIDAKGKGMLKMYFVQ